MFVLINLLMCSCGILMCLSINPVEAVIFLILAFCCAAMILFMFHVEFLGLIFVIIYVGAIAVLFLFVIMMLNIKNQDDFMEDEESLYSFSNLINLFVGSIFISLLLVLSQSFKGNIFEFGLSPWKLVISIDNLQNIDLMGQVLFNYYLICFLLAGMVLLIALVGSIVLTLRFNNQEKSQLANRQLARTENFITFFK